MVFFVEGVPNLGDNAVDITIVEITEPDLVDRLVWHGYIPYSTKPSFPLGVKDG